MIKSFEEVGSNTDLDKKKYYTFIDNTEFSDEIKEAIKGMIGLVISTGKNDINLDFEDLKVIMNHGGVAFSGIGEYKGGNAASEAMNKAIENALKGSISLLKATGILVHFKMNTDFQFMELIEAMNIIEAYSDDDTDMIFGTTTDDSLSINHIKVTLLITKSEDKKYTVANNID